MASIDSELQAIREAVYGEEVRGSIIDALEAMNEQASKAQEWATGVEDPTDEPSETNNAKYYAEQAASSAGTLVIDKTITNYTQSANAGVVGDNLRSVNAFNVISNRSLTNSDGTSSGISYQWAEDGQSVTIDTVSGVTRTLPVYNYMLGTSSTIPVGLIPGHTYMFRFKRISGDSTGVHFGMKYYVPGSPEQFIGVLSAQTEREITIPADITGARICLRVMQDNAPSNVVVGGFEVWDVETPPNRELMAGIASADTKIEKAAAETVYRTRYDLFDPSVYSNTSTAHATFTWNADKTICTINSTAAASGDYINVITFTNARPLIPGKTYYIEFEKSDPNLYVSVAWYTSNSTQIATLEVHSGDRFTIPSKAAETTVAKALLRFVIRTGTTVSNATITNPHLYVVEQTPEYDTSDLTYILNRVNGTKNGVTATWSNDKSSCVLSGTQTGTIDHRLYVDGSNYQTTFPVELKKGKSYFVEYETSDPRLSLHLHFYRTVGNEYENITNTFRGSGILTVPEDNANGNITGFLARLYSSSIIVTEDHSVTVSKLRIYDGMPDSISLEAAKTEPFNLRIMQYNAGMFNFGAKNPYGLTAETYTEKVANYTAMLNGVCADIIGIEEYPRSLDEGTTDTPGSVAVSTLFDKYKFSAINTDREKALFSRYNVVTSSIVNITPATESSRRNGLLCKVHLPNGKILGVMVTAFDSGAGTEHNRLVKLDIQGAIDAMADYDYAFIILDMNNNGTLTGPDVQNIVKGTTGQTYQEGDFTEEERMECFEMKRQNSIDEAKELLAIANANGWDFAMDGYINAPWAEQTYNDPRRPWGFWATVIDNVMYRANGKIRFKGFKVVNDEKTPTKDVPVSGQNTAEDIAARKAVRKLASDHYPVYADFEIL